MKNIIAFIFLCVSLNICSSYSYSDNYLILGKDTFYIDDSFKHLPDILQDTNICILNPNYQIIWKIEKDSLFLVEIKDLFITGCSYNTFLDTLRKGLPICPVLKDLFPNKIKNGKVYTDWITDTIQINIGKSAAFPRLGSFENKYINYYKKEKVIIINKGKIIQIKDFINEDNKRNRLSIFDDNSFDFLINVLNKNLNWKVLPIKERDSLYLYEMLILKINEYGETTILLWNENVINNGNDAESVYEEKIYKDEVNRILKDIKWKSIKKRGKPIEASIVIDIDFNFKNKLVLNPYTYTEPY